MGTDFNYANSNEFRKLFVENSIENDDLKAQVRGNENQFLNNPNIDPSLRSD